MNKNRLEAFSDGVIAILITIMVLELKTPHDQELSSLLAKAPVFLSYILSFIYIGIYWNNHHHMIQTVKHVNGLILWANMHLLFWLSLIPFATAWIGDTHFASLPVAFYSIILFFSGVAYYLLAQALIYTHGKNSPLAIALGKDFKGKISVVIYAVSILISMWWPWVAYGLCSLVALMWLIPDKRIEKVLTQ